MQETHAGFVAFEVVQGSTVNFWRTIFKNKIKY
jgi:hypothetical protein